MQKIKSFFHRAGPNPVANTEKIEVKKLQIKTNLKEKQHKTSCFTSHVYRCTCLAPVIISLLIIQKLPSGTNRDLLVESSLT